MSHIKKKISLINLEPAQDTINKPMTSLSLNKHTSGQTLQGSGQSEKKDTKRKKELTKTDISGPITFMHTGKFQIQIQINC